jgi:hypothetical protein
MHGLSELQRRPADDRSENPLLALLPAISRAPAGGRLLDREIAMHKTVEAIRANAAANGNQRPQTLSELTDIPAPHDPMTGEPFAYQSDGNQFTLEAVVVAGDDPRNGMRIEGTVKP